jgi:hypothetical protein
MFCKKTCEIILFTKPNFLLKNWAGGESKNGGRQSEMGGGGENGGQKIRVGGC